MKQAKVRSRYFIYTVFYNKLEQLVFLKKRESKDIWQNLYDFHLEEIQEKKLFLERVESLEKDKHIVKLQHKLTHQVINAVFFIEPTKESSNFKKLEPVHVEKINTYPIPTLIKNYLEKEIDISYSV